MLHPFDYRLLKWFNAIGVFCSFCGLYVKNGAPFGTPFFMILSIKYC